MDKELYFYTYHLHAKILRIFLYISLTCKDSFDFFLIIVLHLHTLIHGKCKSYKLFYNFFFSNCWYDDWLLISEKKIDVIGGSKWEQVGIGHINGL